MLISVMKTHFNHGIGFTYHDSVCSFHSYVTCVVCLSDNQRIINFSQSICYITLSFSLSARYSLYSSMYHIFMVSKTLKCVIFQIALFIHSPLRFSPIIVEVVSYDNLFWNSFFSISFVFFIRMWRFSMHARNEYIAPYNPIKVKLFNQLWDATGI